MDFIQIVIPFTRKESFTDIRQIFPIVKDISTKTGNKFYIETSQIGKYIRKALLFWLVLSSGRLDRERVNRLWQKWINHQLKKRFKKGKIDGKKGLRDEPFLNNNHIFGIEKPDLIVLLERFGLWEGLEKDSHFLFPILWEQLEKELEKLPSQLELELIDRVWFTDWRLGIFTNFLKKSEKKFPNGKENKQIQVLQLKNREGQPISVLKIYSLNQSQTILKRDNLESFPNLSSNPYSKKEGEIKKDKKSGLQGKSRLEEWSINQLIDNFSKKFPFLSLPLLLQIYGRQLGEMLRIGGVQLGKVIEEYEIEIISFPNPIGKIEMAKREMGIGGNKIGINKENQIGGNIKNKLTENRYKNIELFTASQLNTILSNQLQLPIICR